MVKYLSHHPPNKNLKIGTLLANRLIPERTRQALYKALVSAESGQTKIKAEVKKMIRAGDAFFVGEVEDESLTIIF